MSPWDGSHYAEWTKIDCIVSVSQNANPNDIETGVISNKESSLTVSLFKVEQLRLSRSSLDQGNCTASKRSSHLEKQLCWHQLFSCEMAIFGLTYCEDRFSPAIAQIMANVSHLVAINSSDDELVIMLIKNTFPIITTSHAKCYCVTQVKKRLMSVHNCLSSHDFSHTSNWQRAPGEPPTLKGGGSKQFSLIKNWTCTFLYSTNDPKYKIRTDLWKWSLSDQFL